MARPRIIIADTDVNYILSLQLKFVEEFFEKIDLEIITDRNYFENMFESPQRAEVLIVSEDLYDLSIQKHNIGNVFLMTEKNEEEQTADLNVTRIFKYTSIKDVRLIKRKKFREKGSADSCSNFCIRWSWKNNSCDGDKCLFKPKL